MKEAQKVFVSELRAGDDVDSSFLLLGVSVGRTSRGGTYLTLELGDRSGRIQGKVWDGVEALSAQLTEGALIWVRGHMDAYRGALQLVVRNAGLLDPETADWAAYLPAAPRPEAEMKAELWALIDEIADADYRRFLAAVLGRPEVAGRFYLMPAAKSLHHAYLHGLLEHSLSVGRLAALAAGRYPGLNASLLISGAILHDLGKIWEFLPPPKSDYSTLGRLKGHLVMGCEFLGRAAAETPFFPQAKLELLQHLILSHHGEPEFGAPVRPQLLEAIVLHHLDNIDAKVQAVGSFIETDAGPEGWTSYHRLFGVHYYRTPIFEDAENEMPEPEKPMPPDLSETGSEAESPAAPAGPEPPEEGRLF